MRVSMAAPLRLEISGLTLSEDSIEAGREVWVEAEMLGLATKAQLSTMRQPSDASVVFDFAFEVSADAASAALRGAIESADEEDADVTFTLLSPGARKKPRELASGFINLKGILEEGRDFLSDVPLTDGSRAIGTLTGVRLVAVEALKVAAEALKLSLPDANAAPAAGEFIRGGEIEEAIAEEVHEDEDASGHRAGGDEGQGSEEEAGGAGGDEAGGAGGEEATKGSEPDETKRAVTIVEDVEEIPDEASGEAGAVGERTDQGHAATASLGADESPREEVASSGGTLRADDPEEGGQDSSSASSAPVPLPVPSLEEGAAAWRLGVHLDSVHLESTFSRRRYMLRFKIGQGSWHESRTVTCATGWSELRFGLNRRVYVPPTTPFTSEEGDGFTVEVRELLTASAATGARADADPEPPRALWSTTAAGSLTWPALLGKPPGEEISLDLHETSLGSGPTERAGSLRLTLHSSSLISAMRTAPSSAEQPGLPAELDSHEIAFRIPALELLPSAALTAAVQSQSFGNRNPARLQLEADIGISGVLAVPLVSREVPLVAQCQKLQVGWSRSLHLVPGSSLCGDLTHAIERGDSAASELRISLLAVQNGSRRVLGVCGISLHSVVKAGGHIEQEALRLRDGRDQAVAIIWVTVDASLALSVCAPGATAAAPCSRQRRAEAGATQVQAAARRFIIRQRGRRAEGCYRRTLSVHVHDLVLPADHASSHTVDSACVSLELLGRPLGLGSSLRGRIGHKVQFDAVRSVTLERGTSLYDLAHRQLRSGAPLKLNASISVMRQVHGSERFEQVRYGDATVDLATLLRTSTDLSHRPLPVLAAGTRRPTNAHLVLTAEAVAALLPVARSLNLALGQPTEVGGTKLRVAAAIRSDQARLALLLQTRARGRSARAVTSRRSQRRRIELTGGLDAADGLDLRFHDLTFADFCPSGFDFALELRLGDLEGPSHHVSSWVTEANGPPDLATFVDMRHGSKARGIVRDALYTNEYERTEMQVGLLRRQSQFGVSGALALAGLSALAASSGSEPVTVACGAVRLVELEPQPGGDSASRWLELRSGERVVAQLRLEARGMLLLSRMRHANRDRMHESGAGGGVPLSQEGVQARRRRRGTGGSEQASSVHDIVDEMSDFIIEQGIQSVAAHGVLCVSALFSNPGANQLSSLILRASELSSLTALDLSFCLALRGYALRDALIKLPSLTSLDASACELGDVGTSNVSEAVLQPNLKLLTLRLRGNRITAKGARALARGLARTTSLLTLDVSDNELGDAGLAFLATGHGDGLAVPSIPAVQASKDIPAGLASNSSLTALLSSNNRFGSEALQQLAKGLLSQNHISTLDLGVNPFGSSAQGTSGEAKERSPVSILAFGDALGRTPLRSLRMQYVHAGANLGSCVGRALGGSAPGALRQLNLQGSPLSIAGMRALVTGLSTASVELLNLEGSLRDATAALKELCSWLAQAGGSLRRLNLAHNKIAAADARAIAEALATNTSLQDLDLGANPIEPDGVQSFCAAATANASLRKLGLSYVHVGAAGAVALGELLDSPACALVALDLDGCRLTSKGVTTIAAAIAGAEEGQRRGGRIAKLESLRLEDNAIDAGDGGPGACAALARALSVCRSLSSLFVGGNGLGSPEGADCITALAAGIATSAGLRVLDLGGNQLRPHGLRALLAGLRAQQGLTALEVSGCALGDAGAEALANELRASTLLQFVSASSNEVGLVGGKALADAFEASSSMLQLDLTRNPGVGYATLTRLRMLNVVRGGPSLVNPLDGLTKAEAQSENF